MVTLTYCIKNSVVVDFSFDLKKKLKLTEVEMNFIIVFKIKMFFCLFNKK